MRGIAEIQLNLLGTRLAEQGIALSFDEAALDSLIEEGYDPVYGARPLKRVIQHRLENPLAQALLAGNFVPGDTVRVRNAPGAGLEFTRLDEGLDTGTR